MAYKLNLENLKEKEIRPLGEDFKGTSAGGEEISFTNYYMMKNGKPFFGVSGEFHFSRMSDTRWEDEMIKMKMGGISVVATYLFWIHHEEEEGVFDFTGGRNLRKFVELCHKHGLYVILRVGPFDHGEVRNGGIPDWMYGKPFEARKLSEGFLFYTKRLYAKIGEQVAGRSSRTTARSSASRSITNICTPPLLGRSPRESPMSGCLEGTRGMNICCALRIWRRYDLLLLLPVPIPLQERGCHGKHQDRIRLQFPWLLYVPGRQQSGRKARHVYERGTGSQDFLRLPGGPGGVRAGEGILLAA